MFNRQFTCSRIDLALWFVLTMGSILIVFAGAIYYLTILDEIEDSDRLLYKKTSVMAVNAEYDPINRQVNLENVPLVGINTPPIGTDIVYARWYIDIKPGEEVTLTGEISKKSGEFNAFAINRVVY